MEAYVVCSIKVLFEAIGDGFRDSILQVMGTFREYTFWSALNIQGELAPWMGFVDLQMPQIETRSNSVRWTYYDKSPFVCGAEGHLEHFPMLLQMHVVVE